MGGLLFLDWRLETLEVVEWDRFVQGKCTLYDVEGPTEPFSLLPAKKKAEGGEESVQKRVVAEPLVDGLP